MAWKEKSFCAVELSHILHLSNRDDTSYFEKNFTIPFLFFDFVTYTLFIFKHTAFENDFPIYKYAFIHSLFIVESQRRYQHHPSYSSHVQIVDDHTLLHLWEECLYLHE